MKNAPDQMHEHNKQTEPNFRYGRTVFGYSLKSTEEKYLLRHKFVKRRHENCQRLQVGSETKKKESVNIHHQCKCYESRNNSYKQVEPFVSTALQLFSKIFFGVALK